MSYDHEASDAMGKILKGIVIFAVIGCVTIAGAAYLISQSMQVVLKPEPEQTVKH